MKKRTKKLLLTAGYGTTLASAASESKFFWFFFFKKRTAFFLLSFFLAASAAAQSLNSDPASAGNCPAAASPKTPGDAPGGNVFASHIDVPQPPTMPNNETATYPDITQITPDSLNPTQLQPDPPPNQPFPFSGTINNPILSQGNQPETTGQAPKGC